VEQGAFDKILKQFQTEITRELLAAAFRFDSARLWVATS